MATTVITGAPYPIQVVDFNLVPGEYWERLFRFKNPDGTLIDLTGFSGRGKVTAENSEQATALATITGTVAVNPATGELTYSLPTAQSDLLKSQGKVVYYWLYRTNASAQEQLIFKAIFNLCI